MSSVIDAPSKSRAVIEPACADAPPTMLEPPCCSISKFAVAPD